jgi:transposase
MNASTIRWRTVTNALASSRGWSERLRTAAYGWGYATNAPWDVTAWSQFDGPSPKPSEWHFTPTYSSWIDLVERWFAELTTKWLKRGTHRSTKELEASINDWIERWNDDPKPFVWHRTADEILDALGSYCTRISESGH